MEDFLTPLVQALTQTTAKQDWLEVGTEEERLRIVRELLMQEESKMRRRKLCLAIRCNPDEMEKKLIQEQTEKNEKEISHQEPKFKPKSITLKLNFGLSDKEYQRVAEKAAGVGLAVKELIPELVTDFTQKVSSLGGTVKERMESVQGWYTNLEPHQEFSEKEKYILQGKTEERLRIAEKLISFEKSEDKKKDICLKVGCTPKETETLLTREKEIAQQKNMETEKEKTSLALS